jgi:phosphoglycerate dehydrogenase-like enzyme
MGLAWLKEEPGIEWKWLDRDGGEVEARQIGDLDAVIAWKTRWTKASLAGAGRLVLIARWGVGYDHLDISACTEAGVMVTITPEAVRRPVAAANAAMILALATGLFHKNADARNGLWQKNCLASPGIGLEGKTLGSLGFGNIAKETFRLMRHFGMNFLGVRVTDFDTLIGESDFLMINCPLNEKTRHLIGERVLKRMKRRAYIINLSRGAIIDEKALVQALESGAIAGAGLDVFEHEPIDEQHPLCKMDQVILTPHALALTRDLYQGMARQLNGAVRALKNGRIPPYVVNPEVLETERFRAKMRELRRRRGIH